MGRVGRPAILIACLGLAGLIAVPVGALAQHPPVFVPEPRPLPGGQEIAPDSVEGQNIAIAANFIRSMGNGAMADNILDFLKRRKFFHKNFPASSGDQAETSSVTGNITIDTGMIRV